MDENEPMTAAEVLRHQAKAKAELDVLGANLSEKHLKPALETMPSLKRYIVFVGDTYYPAGTDDIVAVTADLDLAIRFALDKLGTTADPKHRWASVYDIQAEKVAWERSPS